MVWAQRVSQWRMDRDMGGCRSPRGVPRLPLGLLAVLAVSILAWAAIPVGASGDGPRPLADTQGPTITSIAPLVPFAPDALGTFNVTATAHDTQSIVTAAEFFVDAPGNGSKNPFMMLPFDARWDNQTETARWSGPFDFLTSGLAFGDHTLWVHARDVAGNWGPFATASFVLYNANTTGPFTIAVSIAPTDVPTGVPVQLDATLQDWFGDPILAAEFFVDVPGPDGTGTPMSN